MSKRDIQLISSVERELADLAWVVVRFENVSMSSYLRTLLLTDLKSRGLLSVELIEALL